MTYATSTSQLKTDLRVQPGLAASSRARGWKCMSAECSKNARFEFCAYSCTCTLFRVSVWTQLSTPLRIHKLLSSVPIRA